MPEPRGLSVQVNMFTTASHADNILSRRSCSGITIFIGNSTIIWYTKKQNIIESRTFGSEFVAGKTWAELNRVLQYKVRIFGIRIEGPTNMFMDNQCAVYNEALPESTLKQKHNAIFYHLVRKCVTREEMWVDKLLSQFNLSDLPTKLFNGPELQDLYSYVFYD